ncbi:DUF2726 domain-containing protein [Vibrio hepatarius]|uniref:DUF2726 domain-containing protein n=1 Tax=Vibrio hepatarius TaxID=171383 RepID=UPI001C080192|nr:DUF2726 domain-containing protein [Vibrio hepatarius]MBU2898887.1 DUF2726 domain-containing protein [Vibrio hepatarius]
MLLLFCITILFAIIFIVSLLTRSTKTPEGTDTSSKKNTFQYDSHLLFSCPEELEFYRTLSIAVKSREIIFAKVRAADLMRPKKGFYSSGEWQRAYNKLSRKNVDFVLCNPMTLEVNTIIELINDTQEKDLKTENYVEKAAKTAGLNIIRFSTAKSYNYDEIERQLYGDQVELKTLCTTQ